MRLAKMCSPGNSLLVVDLESRGGARPILEWRARRLAARLGARARRGERLPQVLLHLPEGVGPTLDWPGGVRVIRTWERLSRSRLREIHERVFARSFELIRGPIGKLFPNVCGVSLGELNLPMFQGYPASFSVLSSALGDLLAAGEIEVCHIVSADVGFSRALERQVAGRVETVSTWPPWRILQAGRRAKSKLSALRPKDHGKAEQSARDAMAALLRAQGLERARPRVLSVSESEPMAQMFGVIEGALRRAGVGPVIRLDFRTHPSPADESGSIVCRCGDVGSLGLKTGVFRAQWGDAQRALRSHCALVALDGSPDALILEGLIGYLYVSALDAQARHLWAADTVLELLQPEVVLVGNDHSCGGQAFVQLARRRGIASVCAQDGAVDDDPWWWWLTADRLAATSEQLVQMLVRHGVAPERCTVTGQPRYDLLSPSGPADQRAARVALGLDPSKFSVLFAVQTNLSLDYVQAVVAALLAIPGVHVMLRPHPSDRRDLCERLTREYESEHMTLHSAGDSVTLLQACDALVTRNSTVILEAAVLGKPVISVEFGASHGAATFVAAGIATPVWGSDGLAREVQRLVSAGQGPRPEPSRSRQAALATLVGPVDGRAGERVAELVAEVLQQAAVAVPTR